MPLSALTNLKWLDLRANQIADMTPLSALTNLKWLDLSSNQILNITPIKALTNLIDLNLRGNQILDISAICALTNLTELNLSDNLIRNFSPISALTNLTSLNDVKFSEKYRRPIEEWSSVWLLEENNAELRRLLIQVIGYEKICQELKAIDLDIWREYSLLKIALNNPEEEDIYLLKMTCTSTAYIHVIRVPPEVQSAYEAITWINWGIAPEDFAVET